MLPIVKYMVIGNIKKKQQKQAKKPQQLQNSLKFTKPILGRVSAAGYILLHTPFFALALGVAWLLGILVQSTNPAEK